MVWQDHLKENICTIEDLKKHIKLTKKEEKDIQKIIDIHPMSITRYYLSLINKDDKNDPIRKLVVPSEGELSLEGSYDASLEKDNVKTVGLQHKYSQTALILTTNRCTAYCRFCYRKRLVGLPNKEVLSRFNDAINYIKDHTEIDNIVLSGGDCLALPTHIIEKFFESLSSISHIKYVRIATRVPVVFPDRIIEDRDLLNVFKKYSKKKKLCVVTHFNHPREITKKSKEAVSNLMRSGTPIYNQTVLLRDVNDNPDVLAELFNNLIDTGILPYYLFQCRPVKRVKEHFAIPLYKGYEIFENAKKKIRGDIICRRLKYVMSHATGKVEIIGISGNDIYFKYHQAKNPKDLGRFFKRRLNKRAAWLDDLQ